MRLVRQPVSNRTQFLDCEQRAKWHFARNWDILQVIYYELCSFCRILLENVRRFLILIIIKMYVQNNERLPHDGCCGCLCSAQPKSALLLKGPILELYLIDIISNEKFLFLFKNQPRLCRDSKLKILSAITKHQSIVFSKLKISPQPKDTRNTKGNRPVFTNLLTVFSLFWSNLTSQTIMIELPSKLSYLILCK